MTICLRRSSPQNAFQGLSPQAWDASEANEFNGALETLYKILLAALGQFYT